MGQRRTSRERQTQPSAAADASAAVHAAAAVGAVGLAAVATDTLLLFASLGPTAVMQAHSGASSASRPYNILIAHMGGALSGAAAVYILGIASMPSVFEIGVSGTRVAAAALALATATFIELRAGAIHPPAASTTLLMALGSFRPTLHDLLVIVGGVSLLAAVGVSLRRFAGVAGHNGSRRP